MPGPEVTDVITSIFERVEASHGKIFVERAFGYLAASVHGLAEDELLDVLSLDEIVLKDVLVWHTPPQRRVPGVVFTYLRHDLGKYLVERGADGVQVLMWYHRAFREAAFVFLVWCLFCLQPLFVIPDAALKVSYERYLPDEATYRARRTLSLSPINCIEVIDCRCTTLAEYFSGAAQQNRVYEDRGIASQPLILGRDDEGRDILNLRRLSELPHAQTRAGMWTSLRDTLCNLQFVEGKFRAGMAYELLEDLTSALFRGDTHMCFTGRISIWQTIGLWLRWERWMRSGIPHSQMSSKPC